MFVWCFHVFASWFHFQLKANRIRFDFRIILVGLSFTAFYFSKKSIDARRYEHYKIRQRMQEANTGDYVRPDKYVYKPDKQEN